MKVMLKRTLLMSLLVLALIGLMVIGVGAEAMTGTYADDAAAVEAGAVAKIAVDGGATTYYATLADAIADATADTVVTLIADITDLGEPVKHNSTYCYIYVAEDKNFTLDLNDCKIAVADPGVSSNGDFAVVYVKGALTIQDSGATQSGAITVTTVTTLHTSNSSVIENRGGSLTIKSGTIEHKGFNGSALGTFAIHNNTNSFGDSSLSISGGNVIASEGSAIRLTTTSPVEAGSGSTYFLMTGGSVVGKETGIWLMPANNRSDVEAIVSISGGTVTAEVDAFYTNFCTVDTKLSTTISGGTFNGTVQGKDGEIAITGGSFNGEVIIKDGNKVPVEKTDAITGGTFNPAVNPDYLNFSDPATILVLYVNTADGSTILSFNSIEDALDALATVDSSATVNVFVCSDLVLEESFIINSNVTIVGNGKTFYSSVDALFEFTAENVTLALNDITLTIAGEVMKNYTNQTVTTNMEAIANKLNAEGYSLVEDAGIWTVTSANPEAQINGWNYATLADAIAAAQDGETVDVIRDLTAPSDNLNICTDITLDGHGFKVTSNAAGGKAGLRVVDATATIKNLILETTNATADAFVIKHDGGTYAKATIIGCTFTSNHHGLYFYKTNTAEIEVTNTTINAVEYGVYANACTSFTFNATNTTIKNNVKNGILTLKSTGNVTLGDGVVISSKEHGIRFNGSKVNVLLEGNAEITTAANGAVYFAADGTTNDSGSSLTIKDAVTLNGAKFDIYATGAAQNVAYDFSGTTNYKVYNNIVRTSTAVVYHFYETLADALTATVDYQAEAGVKNNIVLLDNVSDNAGITPNKSFILAGNGKAITSSAAAVFTLSDKCAALALNDVTISTSGDLLAGYTNQTVTTNMEAVANKLNAEGYSLVKSAGIWTITSANPQAAIDGWNYATFEDAIDAANDGDTVTMLTGAELTATMVLVDNITVEGNGKTITSTAATMFDVQADVTFNNITLTDNTASAKLFAVTADKTGSITVTGNGTLTAAAPFNILGNAAVTVTDNVKVSATSNRVILADGNAVANITVSGNAEITSTANCWAITFVSNADGTVTVTDNAHINATGTDSYGIVCNSTNAIEIELSGKPTISASKDAIYFGSGVTATDGKVVINGSDATHDMIEARGFQIQSGVSALTIGGNTYMQLSWIKVMKTACTVTVEDNAKIDLIGAGDHASLEFRGSITATLNIKDNASIKALDSIVFAADGSTLDVNINGGKLETTGNNPLFDLNWGAITLNIMGGEMTSAGNVIHVKGKNSTINITSSAVLTGAQAAILIENCSPNLIITGGAKISSTGSNAIEITNSSPTLTISGTGKVTTVQGAGDAIRISGGQPSISVSGNSIIKTTGVTEKHLFNIVDGAHPTINVSGNALLETAHNANIFGHAFRIGVDAGPTANATIILSGSTAEGAAGIVVNASRLLDVRKASSVDFTVRGKVTATTQHQVVYSNGGNGNIKFHVNATEASFKNLSNFDAFNLNTATVDASFVGNVKLDIFTGKPAIVLNSTNGSTLLINGNVGNGFVVNNASNAIRVNAGTSDIDVLGKVDLNCSAEAIYIAVGKSDIALNGTDIEIDGDKAIYVAQDNSKITVSGTVDFNISNWGFDFAGNGNVDLALNGNITFDGVYGIVKKGSGYLKVSFNGDKNGAGISFTMDQAAVFLDTSTDEGNVITIDGKVTLNSDVVVHNVGVISLRANATVTIGGDARLLHTGGTGDTRVIQTVSGTDTVINIQDNAYLEGTHSIIEPEGAANVTLNISGGTLKTTGTAAMFRLTQTGTYKFNITGGTFTAAGDAFYMEGKATDLTLSAGEFNVKTFISLNNVAPTLTLKKGLEVTSSGQGIYMIANATSCQPTIVFDGVNMTAPRAIYIPAKFSDSVYNAVSPTVTVKGESDITTTDWGFKVGDSGAGNAYEGHTTINVEGGTINFRSYGFTQNSTSKTGGTMALNITGGNIYIHSNSTVYIDSDYVGTEFKNAVNMTNGTITFPEGNTTEGYGINVKGISQVAVTVENSTIITNGYAVTVDQASATSGALVKIILRNSTFTSNAKDAVRVSGIAGSTLEIYGCKLDGKGLNSYYDSTEKVTSYNVDKGMHAGLLLYGFRGNTASNTPDVIIGDYIAADGTVVKTEIKATGYEAGKGLNAAVLLTDCADVDLSIGGSTELSTHTSEKTFAFRTLRTTASILFKDNAKLTSSTATGWTIDFASSSTVDVTLTDNVTVTGKHTFVCNSGNVDLVLRGKAQLAGESTSLHFQTGTHTVKIVENATITKGQLLFKENANGTVVIGNAEGYTPGKVVLNVTQLRFEGGATGVVTINGNTEMNTTNWSVDFEGSGNGTLVISDKAVIHSTTYGIVRNGTGWLKFTMNGGKIITDKDDAIYVDSESATTSTVTLTGAVIEAGYSGFYVKDITNIEVTATNVTMTGGTSGWNFNAANGYTQSLTIIGGTHVGNGTGNSAAIYMQGGGTSTVSVTNATVLGHFGFRINSNYTTVTATVKNTTFRTAGTAFQTNSISQGTVSFYDCTFRNATNDWNSGCIYTTEWARLTINMYDCDMLTYSGYNIQVGGGRYNDANEQPIRGEETATLNVYGGTYHTLTSDAVVQTNRFAVANVYGGYFEAHNNTVLRPWDGSTLNVYGGFVYFNPNNVDHGGSCVRVAGGTANMPATANIYGGNFVNRSNAGPVFNGINAERTLNLYDVNGNLVTNANGKPAITAKGGNCLVNNPGTGTPSIKYQVSNQYFTGAAPVRVNGAQIRFATDGNGIRFATTISKDAVNYIKSLIDANTAISYGTIILPTDYLEGGDLTTTKDNLNINHYSLDLAKIKYLDIPASNGLQIDGSGNVTIRAAITNLKETNYDRSFSAVGYIKYVVGGVECYFYSNFDQFDNSRSMKQLAERALEDVSETTSVLYRFPVGDGTYSRYTETQRETLLAYYDAETDNHKTVDLYLIAGQSNGSGYSTFNDAFLTQNEAFANGFENVYYSGNGAGNSGGYQMPHVYDTTKVTAGFGRLENEIGSELGLAAILNQYYNAEEGNIAGIVKYAVGGTSLRDNITGSDAPEGNWCSPSWIEMLEKTGGAVKSEKLTGALYYHFLNQVQNAIDQYKALGYNEINIKGMFWMQGESDRGDGYNHYANMLKYFVTDIRADLGELTNEDLSEMPFVVGAISQSFGRDFSDSNDRFVAMQYRLPELLQDENIHVIDSSAVFATSANSGDSAHYTADDMLMIGKTVGTTLANIYAEDFGIEEPLAHPTTVGDMVAEVVVNGEVVGTYNHLVYALNSAPAGATVRLLADAYVYAGAMNVANRSGSVALDGNGFTIYSSSSYQAFRVIGCSLTLVNVKLVQNGTATNPGASAVFHDAGSLLIVDEAVEAVAEVTLGDQTVSKGLDAYYAINTAPKDAIVKILTDIDVYGDALNIRNTNAITIDGGNHTIAAIAVDDHTIDLFDTDLTMKNWNVVNNEDQNDYHYALYFQTAGAKLTIESGSFDAYHHGVVANKAGNVLVINGGTFSNRQGRNGFDTPVYGNNAAIVTVNGGTFNAADAGTAMRFDGVATVTVNGGTFTTESGEYCIWINNAEASLTIADATAVTFNGATVANVLNNGTGYQP